MTDSSQQRTEQATPKRLREARERGELPRARDLSAALILLGAVLAMAVAGVPAALDWMREALRFDAGTLEDPLQMLMRFAHLTWALMAVALPVMAAAFLVSILAPLLVGGWNFSSQALQPRWDRLNPVAGFARIFSMQSLLELLRSLLKMMVLLAVAVVFWNVHGSDIRALASASAASGVAQGMALLVPALGWMAGGLLAIGLLDAPLQQWQHQRRLRMSKQEVREEMKQTEGRPEVKARIRRVQQELSRRRMMEAIPTADVIITNPTHYAVALRYTAGRMRAPVVVAKGADVLALAIRTLAEQHRIPRVEAPPLARALYRGVALDAEIPPHLYAAVAQVLGYLYQLRAHVRGPLPVLPPLGEIPGGEPDPASDASSG